MLRIFVLLMAAITSIHCYAQIPTTCAAMNVVSPTGNPVFPGLNTLDRYQVEAIALNSPTGLNSIGDNSIVLFVQDNTGGIQVYSGAWYGSGLPNYPASVAQIVAGDLLRVTGLTGHFGGKTNIMERHNPVFTFTIENLGHPGEPVPYDIADLQQAQAFDPSRATGGEFYQGRLVRLRDVQLSSGTWEQGGRVAVADVNGATISVALRGQTGLGTQPAPAGVIDLVGIFNQEDTSVPYTGGYEIWPRSINDFIETSSTVENWSLY
ncbi:MAG: hypothetical protein IPI28_08305 [Candidatus Omnitrophica bacterium]|nr:hypothetical protein [Candidatus Omnitrophota bacterium]